MALHTIITEGNSILETELLSLLLINRAKTRLISKLPFQIKGTTTINADVLNYEELVAAISGSNVVYLAITIPNSSPSWGIDWLTTVRNVINACKECGAKLIYFDETGNSKKDKNINISALASKRKKISRASIEIITSEMDTGLLKAAIARAINVYGPGTDSRFGLGACIFSRLINGHKPIWIGNGKTEMPFTFSMDIARSLYILATNEKGLGQSWNLPTHQPYINGNRFISAASSLMDYSSKYHVIPIWLLKIINCYWLAPFNTQMLQNPFEQGEFDSSKFENTFKFKPSSYQQGIAITAEYFIKEKQHGPVDANHTRT